jgi:hypothetical protein
LFWIRKNFTKNRSYFLAALFDEFAFERSVVPMHLFCLVERPAVVFYPRMGLKFLRSLANPNAQFRPVPLLAEQMP